MRSEAMTSRPELDARPITVSDYHRMIEAGILDEDEHVELLEGVIVKVSPQGPRHAVVIQRLTALLIRQLSSEYAVRPQLPLSLGEASEPEPDLAVVDAAEAASTERHPSHALLVIEVADDSLRKDRLVKASLYAAFDIPEYWIVDLAGRRIEVHRHPDAEARRYRTSLVFGTGQELRCSSVPAVTVRVDEIVP
jgi:Uma2 family endonuclease